MKSDDLLRIRKRRDITFVSSKVSGDEILDLVIEETLASKPWLYPEEDEEDRRAAIIAARYERRNARRRIASADPSLESLA